MSDYGLTPEGPNIKRLDVITSEIHDSLSEKLGINTRQNPQSLLNVLITDFADKIAELWELGASVYYSQYPYSAEGINLDNAAQFGGSTRATPAPSYYHILCTGTDGTTIPSGTIIASDTNPTTQLVLIEESEITRGKFNKANIKYVTTSVSNTSTVAINGSIYTYTPEEDTTAINALKALAAIIVSEDVTVSVDEELVLLCIESVENIASNALILSENLTTDTVSTVITFATEETGDILLPEGAISKIVKSTPGLTSVTNVGSYIAGCLAESDAEFRKSYIDKIFSRSTRMIESVRSAILDNVQGVTSVAAYENDTSVTDDMGRYPHSIEVVVDGGDQSEIAQQILKSKAGGISTYGSISTEVPGEYGENITIRFNRPTYLTVWFCITVTLSDTFSLPTNYVDSIKEIVISAVESLEAGEDVIPQKMFTSEIYDSVSGIDYLDIKLEVIDDNIEPDSYTKRSVSITQRERAVTAAEYIEVLIDD